MCACTIEIEVPYENMCLLLADLIYWSQGMACCAVRGRSWSAMGARHRAAGVPVSACLMGIGCGRFQAETWVCTLGK